MLFLLVDLVRKIDRKQWPNILFLVAATAAIPLLGHWYMSKKRPPPVSYSASGAEVLWRYVIFFPLSGDAERFDRDVQGSILSVERDARAAGADLAVVGVVTDLHVERGLRRLARSNISFDQVVVGGGWTNSAVLHHLSDRAGGRPALPQLILIADSITIPEFGGTELEITGSRVLLSIVGGSAIAEWSARNYPLASSARR